MPFPFLIEVNDTLKIAVCQYCQRVFVEVFRVMWLYLEAA